MESNIVNNVELLEFDSKLFGFGVARILPHQLNLSSLEEILQKLRDKGVKLVYWAFDYNHKPSQQAAISKEGFLVDRKVTYLMSLKNMKQSSSDLNIEEYLKPHPNQELKKLALQVGQNSRFNADPNLSQDLWEQMYGEWITNSVKHLIAKHVFVKRQDNKIVGMITLGDKNNRGDIGLLAVDENYRGYGIGGSLIYAAQSQFIEDGYELSQVVTQLDNISACRLYEKYGYKQEKIEYFYHFWLSPEFISSKS